MAGDAWLTCARRAFTVGLCDGNREVISPVEIPPDDRRAARSS